MIKKKKKQLIKIDQAALMFTLLIMKPFLKIIIKRVKRGIEFL